jgi:hypothetical protein
MRQVVPFQAELPGDRGALLDGDLVPEFRVGVGHRLFLARAEALDRPAASLLPPSSCRVVGHDAG